VTQYGHISEVRFLVILKFFLSSLSAVRLWTTKFQKLLMLDYLLREK